MGAPFAFMRKYLDVIFILGSVSLTGFAMAAANGGHHLLLIAAYTIIVAAINGLVAVFIARFIRDKWLAIIGTIIVTEVDNSPWCSFTDSMWV